MIGLDTCLYHLDDAPAVLSALNLQTQEIVQQKGLKSGLEKSIRPEYGFRYTVLSRLIEFQSSYVRLSFDIPNSLTASHTPLLLFYLLL